MATERLVTNTGPLIALTKAMRRRTSPTSVTRNLKAVEFFILITMAATPLITALKA